MSVKQISRRTILRGSGVAVALPFLEAMMPRTLLAAPAAKAPVRMGFVFIPNGVNMGDWKPGKVPGLPPTLQPLKKVADRVTVHRREKNGGRGAALKTGYRLARERGFTHALQLDADGQHDADAVPDFLQMMEREPRALVLGAPQFDATAPRQTRSATATRSKRDV